MGLKTMIMKLLRRDLDRNYVSPADQFLTEFDVSHPNKSLSQRQEIAKYSQIAKLRDVPTPQPAKDIWGD